MVDGTALEMRSTFTGIVGSNPTLSATLLKQVSVLLAVEDFFLELVQLPQLFARKVQMWP